MTQPLSKRGERMRSSTSQGGRAIQVCAQRHEVATNGRVFPSKSGNKPHKVYAWKPGAPEVNGCFCSCQAFIFGRSKVAKKEEAETGKHVDPRDVVFVCKHLQEVFDTTCDWIQHTDADYQYDQTCPKCRGPLVNDDDEIVVPEDTTGAVNDLRGLLADLAGEEPPEPLPEPRSFVVEFTVSTEYTVMVTATSTEDAQRAFLSAKVDKWLKDDTLYPCHEEVKVDAVRDPEDGPDSDMPQVSTTVQTDAQSVAIDLAGNVRKR